MEQGKYYMSSVHPKSRGREKNKVTIFIFQCLKYHLHLKENNISVQRKAVN